MKTLIPRTCLIASVAFMAACAPINPSLTSQEHATVTELTKDLKPRCVGRYLIDLPANVKVRGGAQFEGVVVNAEPKEQWRFALDMRRREEKLKTSRHVQGYKFLYDHGKVWDLENTQYFVSLDDVAATSDIKRLIEAYKWDRGYQITLKIEASDSIHSEYAKRTQGTPYGITWPKNNVPQKTRLVFDLIKKLQGRAEDTIPTEPGACFFGGFLPGKAVSKEEEINAFFVFPNRPDASFSWNSLANLKPETMLLPRMRKNFSQGRFKEANGRLIRSDSIDLPSGIKADEALVSATTTTSNLVQGHVFSLETNYESGALTPYLLFEMNNGYPNYMISSDAIKQASLTEGEAIALWDAVTRTLRPRPNGF